MTRAEFIMNALELQHNVGRSGGVFLYKKGKNRDGFDFCVGRNMQGHLFGMKWTPNGWIECPTAFTQILYLKAFPLVV